MQTKQNGQLESKRWVKVGSRRVYETAHGPIRPLWFPVVYSFDPERARPPMFSGSN